MFIACLFTVMIKQATPCLGAQGVRTIGDFFSPPVSSLWTPAEQLPQSSQPLNKTPQLVNVTISLTLLWYFCLFPCWGLAPVIRVEVSSAPCSPYYQYIPPNEVSGEVTWPKSYLPSFKSRTLSDVSKTCLLCVCSKKTNHCF